MAFFKSLMTQFIIGASFLISSILLLVFSQHFADKNNQLLSQWQHQGEQLRYEMSALKQQAQHYKLNAPRDFESYERDKSVFFQQFKQQINTIELQNEAINQTINGISGSSFLELLNSLEDTMTEIRPLDEALKVNDIWTQDWNRFDRAVVEALGSSTDPRLEWGADIVIQHEQGLLNQSKLLNEKINLVRDWFTSSYDTVRNLLIMTVFGYIIIAIIALAYFVIRPIVLTSRACSRVSMGEYGLSINSLGSRETKQLQQSFNNLSATTKLIMDLLKEVNQAGNTQEKLQHIYYNAQKILGINWIGLMAVKEQHIELLESASHRQETKFRHNTVSMHKRLGKDMQQAFKEGWFEITELGKMTLQHHDERFLREIHTKTNATQVIGHPFHCPKHNGFLLIFTTAQLNGFSSQQITLAQALVKLMSDAIISGLNAEPAPLKAESFLDFELKTQANNSE